MNIEPLIYWVGNREILRLKRLAGESPPWTTDPILQTYRFCNVRRRDDRVSQWLQKNVLKQEHIDLSLSSFLMFSALCRWINWPPTIDAILQAGLYPVREVDWGKIGELLDSREGKVWTGAYMILAPKESLGVTKGKFIAELVVGRSMRQHIQMIMTGTQMSKEIAWTHLKSCLYFGNFMAGQIVDDWSWTSVLKDAPDNYTWAPQGPGSLRGYKRLAYHDRYWPAAPNPLMGQWCQTLQVWREEIVARFSNLADMTLMDVQNCLCEVDKFLRVKNGEGRPRATYKPETAY